MEYIGYNIPHVLEDSLLLRIKFKQTVDINLFLIESIDYILDLLKNISKEWIKISGLQQSKYNFKEVEDFMKN